MSSPKRQPRTVEHIECNITIIGERIKELRNEYRYSLSTLAKLVGLGKSTLAGYEGGYRFPSIDKLDTLAKVLETSTDYLLGLTNNRKPKDIKQYLNGTDLVYDGEPLTAEQIETLNKFLESFVLVRREKK
jgi:transcriptional regulator with XRE-family HTH domain